MCTVAECQGLILAKGYCKLHYQQMYRKNKIYPALNEFVVENDIVTMNVNNIFGKFQATTKFNVNHLHKVKMHIWSYRGGYVVNRDDLYFHNYLLATNEKVDHADRNRLNNMDSNLRVCSFQENNRNKSKHKNNSSGVTGVSWRKDANCWRANITVDYKNIALGSYKNKEDAIRVRLKAESDYFKEFAPQKHLFEKYNIE